MEEKGRKIKKQDNGITLVALVITIIIIIILATVTINMAFGDNGLIKQAQLAKDMTANSTVSEQEEMNSLMQEYSNVMAEDSELENKYDIFVYLYDDGTLTFGTQNQPIEEKNVVKEYGNIKGQEYTSWNDENNNYVSDIPWFNDRTLITKVSIVDEIVPLSMDSWFGNCENLTEIENIEKIDTSEVESMYNMFNSCKSLTSIDLSSFNTENVTNMAAMFAYCSSLTSIDLSSFNTSNVTNMEHMFDGCTNLTSLNLSNFNTSKVEDMGWMFLNCSNLTNLDLSSFDTSNIKLMEAMFAGCTNLTIIYVGDNWDLTNVENTEYMFESCGTSTTTPKGSNL